MIGKNIFLIKMILTPSAILAILLVVIFVALLIFASSLQTPSQETQTNIPPENIVSELENLSLDSVSCPKASRTDFYLYSPQAELFVGILDDLNAGIDWSNNFDGSTELVDSSSFPLGSTSLLTASTINFNVEISHVDDSVCGPGGGTIRSFNVEEPISQGGSSLPVRGLESVGGGTTSLNAFEFTLDQPCGGFGLDLLDFESDINFAQGRVKAWDSNDVLIFDQPVETDGMDGVLFVGLTDASNRIKTIRIIVGDSNGGTLSDQLACANFRIGVHNQPQSAQVKRIISAGDFIKIEFRDIQTNLPINDAQIINSLVPF